MYMRARERTNPDSSQACGSNVPEADRLGDRRRDHVRVARGRQQLARGDVPARAAEDSRNEVVGLLAWALRVRRRSQASEAAIRELLETAAKATEGKPWSGEMLELLARQVKASRVRELRELSKH
jgi:hypothetical protein